MSKTAAALAWAARGFRVFPLRENGTRPIWEGWPETATTDPDTIRAWWDGSDFNIGVCTTGMLVIDIDVKAGKPGMMSWMELHGGFDTLTVKTKSGGFHLYYTGADVAGSVDELGIGLDVRSHNNYVVAPGSVVDGRAYSVELDIPVAWVPPDIVARCRPPGMRATNAAAALVEADTPASIRLAVQRIESTQGAVSGEQSDQAYRLACALRDYGVSEGMCATLMDVWAARCSPPIGAEDLRHRVANAYRHAQNPQGAKHPAVAFGEVSIPPVVVQPVVNGVIHGNLGHFGNALRQFELAPRPHVLKGLLLLQEVTALLAPGGVGKSLLTLVVAACLATGNSCFGFENRVGRPAKSIIYDAEDSLAEMSMRLHAVTHVLHLDFEAVASRVSLISGRTHGRIRLVTGGQQPSVHHEHADPLIRAAADPEVVMLALNPLNKLHTCNGIDNIAMTYVMDTLDAIAEHANVALLLAHHTSKPSTGVRRAGNQHTSQGAEAVVNGARTVLTLYPPEDEDAARFGLSAQDRRMFLRLDDAKLNRTLSGGEAIWLRKVSVRLWNGEMVGGLDIADMHAKTEHLRQMIGRALKTGIEAAGSATVKLSDAVSLLKAHEAIFEKAPNNVVKQRIQSYLAEPIVIADGSKLRCFEERGTWMVGLE